MGELLTSTAASTARRPQRSPWVAPAIALVAAVLLIDLWVALVHPVTSGDTAHLVIGADHIVSCLRHGVYTGCDTWRSPGGAVGQFPLFQYVPAVLLRGVGLSANTTLHILTALNAISLFVLVGISWRTVRRLNGQTWTSLFAAAILSSPLLWYGSSAFGEALGALLVVAGIAAALCRKRPVLLGVLVALASTTKETNPLFVAALAVLCVLAVRANDARRDTTKRLIAIGIGAGAGAFANAGFNIVRYGSVSNAVYSKSFVQVPSNRLVARFFAAQWIAPNGGLLWFWPLALAIFALASAGAILAIRRSRPSWALVTPLLTTGIFVVMIGGLSKWFSPFGWIAWGPRLTLTLLPAMLLIVCALASRNATKLLWRVLTGWAFWPVVAITISAGLPQAAVLFQPRAIGEFFRRDNHCAANAHVTINPSGYYHCLNYTAWKKQPFLLERGLEGLNSFGGQLIAVVLATAIVVLFLAAREHARFPTRDDGDRGGSGARATLDQLNESPSDTNGVTAHFSRAEGCQSAVPTQSKD